MTTEVPHVSHLLPFGIVQTVFKGFCIAVSLFQEIILLCVRIKGVLKIYLLRNDEYLC